jgi:ribonucleoside-diphosphate reductase alpha chain
VGERAISPMGHVKMMAAAQPFISGAISKTVNLPESVTVEDIAGIYTDGWKLGLKALAIYRDGSKTAQALKTDGGTKTADEAAEAAAVEPARAVRHRMPTERQSLTHKFNIAGHEGYINVGLYPDGRPGELFITMAKEGSTIGGLMDAFGTAISINLQYGVPLDVLVQKFSHARFEPMGHTTNPDIRIAKSVVDYIFRWLGITFLEGYREQNRPSFGEKSPLGLQGDEETERSPGAKMASGPDTRNGTQKTGASQTSPANGSSNGHHPAGTSGSANGNGNGNGNGAAKASPNTATVKGLSPAIGQRAMATIESDLPLLNDRSVQFARFQSDAPSCDVCGAITVRSGNCYLCYICGTSKGCS